MMRIARLLLLSIISFGCVSCAWTTDVAVVDTAWGFEHVVSARALHLETTRVRLHPPRQDEQRRVYPFFLRFEATNRSNAPWVIKRDEFEVKMGPCADAPCPAEISAQVPADLDTLLTVAGRSSATLSLPIHLVLSGGPGQPGSDVRDVEGFHVELLYREPDRHPMLAKRIAIGSYNQAGQGLRLVGLITVGLVALSFL